VLILHLSSCEERTPFNHRLLYGTRELPLLQVYMDTHRRLSNEQDFREGRARELITQGWISAQQGQPTTGVTQIREGLTMCEAAGTQLERSRHLALLAEAYALNGQPEEGLIELEAALRHVARTGERYYEAEIYRLKGTLTLQSKIQSPKSKVEEEATGYFLKAIEIAHTQQAKSLELRATMSLVRLRQQQAQDYALRNTHHVIRTRLAEAHNMLSDIYHWFTEGFATTDLQEAKALLDDLAATSPAPQNR